MLAFPPPSRLISILHQAYSSNIIYHAPFIILYILSSYSQSIILFTSLSENEPHPDSPLTISFRTFTTSNSHLPNTFCITFKLSHPRGYHASAPHPNINVLTIIAFDPSLPITYLLPYRSAAYFTIHIGPFASFILSPMLFNPNVSFFYGDSLSICILQLLQYSSFPSSIYTTS